MKYNKLDTLAAEWENEINTVLCLEDLSLQKIQQLLKETYQALTLYHKDELVPKQIGKIILNMEDFLFFASLMEDKEMGYGYYHYEAMRYVVSALKDGFFLAEYQYAFPKLLITDILDNQYLLDLENDRIEGYIVAVQNAKAEEI